jgi:drug/metabolite transporter (DMT)-like permease
LTIRSAVDQVFADMLQSFFPLLRLIVKDYLNESFHWWLIIPGFFYICTFIYNNKLQRTKHNKQ